MMWVKRVCGIMAIVWGLSVTSIVAKTPESVLRVGYISLVSQLPIVLVYANDRLKFKHTRLEIDKYTSFTSLEAAMRVGVIHMASLPVCTVLSMAADGLEMMVLGAFYKGGSRMVAKKAMAMKDLKGRIIGVPSVDANENIELKYAMEALGLRQGMDYYPISVCFSSVVDDLKGEKLDIFYLPEPFGTQMEHAAIGIAVEGQKDVLAALPGTLMVIRKDTFQKKEKSVTEYMETLLGACRFIESDIVSSHGVQVAISQEPYTGLSREVVADALSNRKGGLVFGPFPNVEDTLSLYMDRVSAMKLITRSVIIDEMIHTEMMKNASK